MRGKGFGALLAVLLAAGPAAGQKGTAGQVAYVEGLRAFDAGDYVRSAERMRTALAEDAREGTARFRHRAQNAEDYFPHLWLGLSLEKLGDADGARSALGESRRQGAVAARPALARILAAALVRLTPAPPTPTPVPPPPTPSPVPSPGRTTPPEDTVPTVVVPTIVPATARPAATPSPAGPSTAPLRAGLRAFLRGDYHESERLLATEKERTPAARLVVAWSLAGRHLLAGSRDPALLERAREERARALRDGAPAASPPWLSPAIAGLLAPAAPSR